jgi:hypothetical protein
MAGWSRIDNGDDLPHFDGVPLRVQLSVANRLDAT